MIKLIQKFFNWIFSIEPKSWAPYNGWIDEPLSGVILTTIVAVLFGFSIHNIQLDVILTFLTASALSLFYEKKIDVHGWSLGDFMQRYIGILLVLVIWLMIVVKP